MIAIRFAHRHHSQLTDSIYAIHFAFGNNPARLDGIIAIHFAHRHHSQLTDSIYAIRFAFVTTPSLLGSIPLF